MSKHIVFIFFILLVIIVPVRGQSDPQMSQYMFNQEGYNPSVLAEHDAIELMLNARQQWSGIPNAPITTIVSGNIPFKAFLNKKQGIGIAFVGDDFGIFSNESGYLQYAIQFKINDENHLSIGTNIGFINQTIAGDSVRIVESDYHQMKSDQAIPTTSVNDFVFDAALGLTYSGKDFYLGLSMLHLFSPELDLDDYVKSYILRTAYLTGGYTIPLNNMRYVLMPSFLLKTDFVSYQTDVSARIVKDNKYWLGLSWRLQDAVVFYGGMKFMNGLTIGCSYDLSTSRILAYSWGSYELILRYAINIGKSKKNKYKSVRVL